MKNVNEVIELLESLNSEELMKINNTYCNENRYNGIIYHNTEEELNELFSSPSEALRAATYGSYHYSHNYFRFNGYGNLESFPTIGLDNLVDTPANIAEHMLENPFLYLNLDEE